ncbi:12411_t:CDS:1, partial [Racocetra persica]
AAFDQAAKEFGTIVTNYKDKVSNEEKLKAYGLFKQGTIGDNTT